MYQVLHWIRKLGTVLSAPGRWKLEEARFSSATEWCRGSLDHVRPCLKTKQKETSQENKNQKKREKVSLTK